MVRDTPGGRENVDEAVVADFGREWDAFNHSRIDARDLEGAFLQYFRIFPFDRLGADARGFDMGCGSGRWARFVAPRVGHLSLIDPSPLALARARDNLAGQANVSFECAPVSGTSLAPASQDFGYCLGVLHHIPDTQAGLRACASLLRPGAPFLLYLYYRFDDKPLWFKAIWHTSDLLRRGISRLPFALKLAVSQIIALTIYLPLAMLARLLSKLGFDVANIPLSDYRDKSFYIMRTDALDRFGTRLEKRFLRSEIMDMMHRAGFEQISFSDGAPFWVCVGYRKGA